MYQGIQEIRTAYSGCNDWLNMLDTNEVELMTNQHQLNDRDEPLALMSEAIVRLNGDSGH